MPAYLLHENDAWLPPFRAAFARHGLAVEEWHLAEGGFDFSSAPPPGVFYNRMSASAHTRGHDTAPELTAAVLAWLEAHGRRVINGSRALDLEVSKIRQYAALQAAGVRVPATRFASGRAALRREAESLGAPFIAKPNRGGKGLGVSLFSGLEAFDAWLESPDFDPGRDGITLLQQRIVSPESAIIRCEFVGGHFLYAVRVDTSGGFELCPAEACRVGDAACPVGEEAPRAMFEILQDFTPPDLERYEALLAAHDIAIAGIELIVDAAGEAWTYDINTNTNYNPEAEAAAGRTGTAGSGPDAVARLIARELAAGGLEAAA